MAAGVAAGGRPGVGHRKLAWGAIGFLTLTVGMFWYQFSRIRAGDASPNWTDLRWGYLPLILLCLPVETVASALRIWLLSRVLHPGLCFWTCVKAEWANVAISILTPSQSGGGPGQIYVLSRDGVRVGTSLTIALLSFVGTMVGVGLMGLYSLLVSGIGLTGPLFAGAVWMLTAISAAMVLAATWPGLFRVALAGTSRMLWRLAGRRWRLERCADLIYAYGDDVRRFLRHGKANFVAVCLLSVTFLFTRALLPYLCARFLGVQAGTLRHVLDLQIALIFLIFFAPTPGGAGVAEGASLAVMADIVPAGFAPYYNLLWRASTAYLAALAGFACLARALIEDARTRIRRAGTDTAKESSP